MAAPRALVLTGYGINCDEETKHAFEQAGSIAEIVHINDLIDSRKNLKDYQILAFPGGFSYGDDLGAGVALAHRIRNNLWDEVSAFVTADTLTVGICNGFQVLMNLGLLPSLNGHRGARQGALVHNTSGRYLDRWVDLRVENQGPWTSGIYEMRVPIAHGEGRMYAESATLQRLHEKGMIAMRYVSGEICRHFSLPANPNGSLDDIAGITDESRHVLGLMPHPERAVAYTHLPHWTWLKERYQRAGKEVPTEGDGLGIFKNGVRYFT